MSKASTELFQHVAGQRAVIAGRAGAELQRAGGDRRQAGIGVRIGQGQQAVAERAHRAAAADRAGKGLIGIVVEDERGIVDDRAGERAVQPRLAGAKLQRAGGDRRPALIGVGGIGQRQVSALQASRPPSR